MTTDNKEKEINSGYPRLETQITWYDTRANDAQKFYKGTKFVEVLLAAFIPFITKTCPGTTAVFGIVIIVLECLQQMNHWAENWVTYRSTCEDLRHEKYSYLGKAGVYKEVTPEEAKILLTERVESLVSAEHARWITRQDHDKKPAKK